MDRRALAVLVAAAAVVVAGCGDGVAHGPATVPAGPAKQSVECGKRDAVVTPQGAVTVVCLGVGSTLRLQLAAGDAQPSAQQGDALVLVSPLHYNAVRPGRAELTGSRRSCPSAAPGAVACGAIAQWKVQVDVR